MCVTCADDPDPVASLGKRYANDTPEYLADNIRPNFSVISSLIRFIQGHAIGKDLRGIRKINPMLRIVLTNINIKRP